MIEFVRVFKATPPFEFVREFRPIELDEWHEDIEGNTALEVLIDETQYKELRDQFYSPYSLVISLISDTLIRHDYDFSAGDGSGDWAHVNNYIYDSYYVTEIVPDTARRWRMRCVGAKSYLGQRLAIPAIFDGSRGGFGTNDGTVDSKPMFVGHIWRIINSSFKGIAYRLIQESKKLQDMPISLTTYWLDGTTRRTYLFKDFYTIEEAIENMIDDENGPDVIFDGGFGDFDAPRFVGRMDTAIYRGITTELSARNSEIIKPTVETTYNSFANNIWYVGDSVQGVIALAHAKKYDSQKVLIQAVNKDKSNVSVTSTLASYANRALATRGAGTRTMRLVTSNNAQMFGTLVGGTIRIKAPEYPEYDGVLWRVVSRSIGRALITFDMMEVVGG